MGGSTPLSLEMGGGGGLTSAVGVEMAEEGEELLHGRGSSEDLQGCREFTEGDLAIAVGIKVAEGAVQVEVPFKP